MSVTFVSSLLGSSFAAVPPALPTQQGCDATRPVEFTEAMQQWLPESAPAARKLAELLPAKSELVDDGEVMRRFQQVRSWLDDHKPGLSQRLGLNQLTTAHDVRVWTINWSNRAPLEQCLDTSELNTPPPTRGAVSGRIQTAIEKFPTHQHLRAGYEQGDWSRYLSHYAQDGDSVLEVTKLMIGIHEGKLNIARRVSETISKIAADAPYVAAKLAACKGYDDLLDFKEHWFAHTQSMQRNMCGEGTPVDGLKVWLRYEPPLSWFGGSPDNLRKP